MPEPVRAAIDQLAYLLDELEALKEILPTVPDDLLSASRYDGDPSIKQLFAVMEALDAGVRLGSLRSGGPGEAQIDILPDVDPDANATDVNDLLDRLRDSRRELVAKVEEYVKGLSVNNNDAVTRVLSYLHSIIQQDTDILRRIAELLNEGRPVRG